MKDNVKEGGGSAGGNFDTLREAAEENSEPEEDREGDDTEIEVLKDGLERSNRSRSSKSSRKREEPSEESSGDSNPMLQQESSDEASDVDTDALEQKMDTLIEQNERIIEILESFGS